MFEMLIGYPPFFSEDPSETYNKILNWEDHFEIPDDANISPQAMDLICRLMNHKEERLGINGVEEIKAHPFFFGVKWRKLKEMKPPFIPDLKDIKDTKYFDNYEEEEPWWIPEYDKVSKIEILNDNYNQFLFFDFTLKHQLDKKKQEKI